MSCVPDVTTTRAMYANYLGGASCTVVAALFGVTRQTVYERLKRQRLPLRRRVFLPVIEHNGARYAPNKGQYFRKTTGDRELLHWDVWAQANGRPVPRGHVVIFVDGDRLNLAPDNLDCVEKGGEVRARPITLKACLACERPMGRRATGRFSEPPSAYAKRKTCNSECAGEWKRGRPRGSRMP